MMVKILAAPLLSVIASLLLFACTKDNPGPDPVRVLSATINGAALTDGAANIPTDATVVFVFSAALSPAAFEAEFSITSPAGPPAAAVNYSNQSSRVTITLDLAFQTTYTLTIGDGPVGQNGERLESVFSVSFTTLPDGTIYSLPPCTSGNDACLHTVNLTGEQGAANVQFYASFPVYEEMAEWSELKAAVIVVHGASRNPPDYFNYLINTLQAKGLEEEVVLIAPFFKSTAEAADGDYYWSGNDWREGRNTAGPEKISSFGVVDQLIDQLADQDHFPVLEKIIVTGQSSGGLFTHLYAAANQAEEKYPAISFAYVVSESQYFYYPDGRRIDENTNQLYTPVGCTGYDIWPLGYNVVPPYLFGTDQPAFNDRFINRSVTYLLGNGSGSDGALNTTDCPATLLGSSRYQRGENMFRYLELVYPGIHRHTKTVAAGISHDGSAIYQSPEFRLLLEDLLN